MERLGVAVASHAGSVLSDQRVCLRVLMVKKTRMKAVMADVITA